MNYIVETKNLSYYFKKREQILFDLNLQVPKGSIYGFLGPNGAGKTTTLRLLLSLLTPKKDTVFIFGKEQVKHRVENLERIGSLIEQPSLYLHLTGKENLEIYRRIFSLPKSRIDEMLALVDLTEAKDKKAKAYSLGMKQRLSIAIALLHSPELLILDEPTNGLDPNGIIEMRKLLSDLQESGVTIIISSHILSEVEKVVTHLGIIRKGKLVFQGTKEMLYEEQRKSEFVYLRCDQNDKVQRLLKNENLRFEIADNGFQVSISTDEQSARLVKLLVQNEVAVYEYTPERNDLENIFLDLTS